jgi:hypothetical protein
MQRLPHRPHVKVTRSGAAEFNLLSEETWLALGWGWMVLYRTGGMRIYSEGPEDAGWWVDLGSWYWEGPE